MYMFIGRPLSWTDDSTTLSPVDSLNDEYDAYANMTALKKVSSTDVSHGYPKRLDSTIQYMTNIVITILQATLQTVVHQHYGHQHSMLSPVITMYIK